MHDHYSWPKGFRYDSICQDDNPVVIDKNSSEYNAEEKYKEMLEYVKNTAKIYRGDHLLLPMGDDFSYSDAKLNYDSMDNLI